MPRNLKHPYNLKKMTKITPKSEKLPKIAQNLQND